MNVKRVRMSDGSDFLYDLQTVAAMADGQDGDFRAVTLNQNQVVAPALIDTRPTWAENFLPAQAHNSHYAIIGPI